jgi:hypothetical protein
MVANMMNNARVEVSDDIQNMLHLGAAALENQQR